MLVDEAFSIFISHMFQGASVQVSGCLSNIGTRFAFRAQLTFNFVIDVVSPAIASFSRTFFTTYTILFPAPWRGSGI